MKRLFFALLPGSSTIHILQTIMSKLDDTACNRVNLNNLHVTLAFIGALPESKLALLRQHIKDVSVTPFDITFDQVLYWNAAQVMCLGSRRTPENLLQLTGYLHKTLQDCAIVTDSRAYVPHITLARKVKQAQMLEIQPIKWTVEGFYLLESIRDKDEIQYPVVDSWLFS